MSLQDKIKPFLKFLKIAAICGSGTIVIAHQIRQTVKSLNRVVNDKVLDTEKKHTAEYIYIDDPSYSTTLKLEQDKQNKQAVGLVRIWKSLKHSLQWRLLWLCRHGNREQRNIAIEKLAVFKNNKNWDCLKLAQALDKDTAVLLARTQGVDNRYFLPAPIHVRRAALTTELLSFKFRDLIVAVNFLHPHSCIEQFLSKYFANVQEQAMEADNVPAKPDSISEHDLCILCLDAIYHHLDIFHCKEYELDLSTKHLINLGLLPQLAELLIRYSGDSEIDFAVLRIVTILSSHTNLLNEFFQNGLIKDLARMIKSRDVRLSSSAASCLANFSGENCYRSGLYLLYPLYRTTTPPSCEILLIHGLRGGVFVTWRQRDKDCAQPIGIIEVTVSDMISMPCEEKSPEPYMDPELKQVIDDLNELDEENLLSDYDVILHDLPIEAKRENDSTNYMSKSKRMTLKNEEEDKCSYTFCWPKDWLPKDFSNLRILGVNYWSSLSEWLERCPMQTADICTRADELGPNLIDAGIVKKNIPIVWLAHSMGGLIVKQILAEAAESESEVEIELCKNTKAVLFFSTPHRGSALAAMPRAAAAVLWPSNDVIQLQENSPTLLDLHKRFLKFSDVYKWETISFAETKPTLVTTFKVPVHFVKASSADLGRGVFYQLPLDHLSICKPATRESIVYKTVADVLFRVTHEDCQLQYSNPIIRWLMCIIFWIIRRPATDVLEHMEDKSTNEHLRWFDNVLLHTFSDF